MKYVPRMCPGHAVNCVFMLVILVSLDRVVKWDITWFTGMLMGLSIHVVNKTMRIKLRASNKPTTKIGT